MKELLNKITKISQNLHKESHKSETMDKILAQLNLATSVSLENAEVEKLIMGVNCARHQTTCQTVNWCFKVRNVSEGLYSNYSLEVFLQNSSNILLESGWKFAVLLVPVDEFKCAKSSESNSFILPEIQPSHKHSLNIKINSRTISNLPVLVQISLIWNPNVPKSAETVGNSLTPICLSLEPSVLNILDFCSIKDPAERIVSSHIEPSLSEQLKTLSVSRPSVAVFGFSELRSGASAMPNVGTGFVPKPSVSSSQTAWSTSFVVDEKSQCKKCFEVKDIAPGKYIG
jgi:hypothetical protein